MAICSFSGSSSSSISSSSNSASSGGVSSRRSNSITIMVFVVNVIIVTFAYKILLGEQDFEKKLFAAALWAIGNLVQLGKGPEMVMNNDASSRSPTGRNLNLVGNLKPSTEKKSKKNSTRFLDQNIAAITYKVLALSYRIQKAIMVMVI